MFTHPLSPVAENENSPTNIPILHPRYYELRPQPLQILPAIFDPSTLNFNIAHHVQQEVDQQSNHVASASRGKSPRIRWTDELHARFVTIVNELGGPWGNVSFAKKQKQSLRDIQKMGADENQVGSSIATHAFAANDQAGSSTTTHAFDDDDTCNLETLAAAAKV
ncbi:hypothetical protein CQW23_10066 [Capsicum baccatum]|uniref:Myb-like domain-containing protein n=1 Tax=Capsicum baccatum TaxID=33114 RepID=A0A2G2WYR7_CAPBA|nr:hypothetical protein CQW23_10066 [Capsicum baccatum]